MVVLDSYPAVAWPSLFAAFFVVDGVCSYYRQLPNLYCTNEERKQYTCIKSYTLKDLPRRRKVFPLILYVYQHYYPRTIHPTPFRKSTP